MSEPVPSDEALLAELAGSLQKQLTDLEKDLVSSENYWQLISTMPKTLDENAQFIENYLWKVPFLLSDHSVNYVNPDSSEALSVPKHPIFERQFAESVVVQQDSAAEQPAYDCDSNAQLELFKNLFSEANLTTSCDSAPIKRLDCVCKTSRFREDTILLGLRLLGYAPKPQSMSSTNDDDNSSKSNPSNKGLRTSKMKQLNDTMSGNENDDA